MSEVLLRRVASVAGFLAGLAFLALVGWIVWAIVTPGESDWPMYWFLAAYVTVPSIVFWLVLAGLGAIFRHATRDPAVSAGTPERVHPFLFHFWPALALLVAMLVFTLVRPRLQLSPLAHERLLDHANFDQPFAVFALPGAFVFPDMIRRLVLLLGGIGIHAWRMMRGV